MTVACAATNRGGRWLHTLQIQVAKSAVVVVAALVLAACGSADDQTQIRVSAASSLADVFASLEVAFEEAHPGTDVVLNIAGSSLLREQIIAGAPIDVFASASAEIMAEVEMAGFTEPEIGVFAQNHIEIAVPKGNPAGIGGLEDFERDELLLGLCAAAVPCGVLAGQSFEAAGIDPMPDTNEPNVRSLLTKIEAGELDAGIVYITDVIAGDVDGIPIPRELLSSAVYPASRIVDSPNPSGGAEFLEFLFSDEAKAILFSYGFQSP